MTTDELVRLLALNAPQLAWVQREEFCLETQRQAAAHRPEDTEMRMPRAHQ